MIFRKRALSHQSGRDRHVGDFRQLTQFFRRFGQEHTVPREDDRLRSRREHLRGFSDAVVRADAPAVLGTTRQGHNRRRGLRREDVHRHVNQDRPGASGLRDIQRARHDVRQEVHVIDAPHALAEWPVDIALRCVGVKSDALMRLPRVVVRLRVAREHQHRRRVGGGRHDTSKGVREARREMHIENGELVRHAEVRVGGVRCHLLVTERHVLNSESVTRIDQCVIRVAALPEHFRNAFLLQALGDVHRSGHESAAPSIDPLQPFGTARIGVAATIRSVARGCSSDTAAAPAAAIAHATQSADP